MDILYLLLFFLITEKYLPPSTIIKFINIVYPFCYCKYKFTYQ